MKRALIGGLCLLLAMAAISGCKSDIPPVNLGSFSVRMPGTIEKSNEQLPTTEMGLNVSTPLVMTTSQSIPNASELYLAISMEWEQTLQALEAQQGGQFDQNAFMKSIEQNVTDLLTLGATADAPKPQKYGGMDGTDIAFEILQSAETDISIWPDTRGDLVSFVSPKRLVILVYAADKSVFSARHRDDYFSSIVITQP